MVVNVEAPEISPSLSLSAVYTLTTFLTSQPTWLCSHDSCLLLSPLWCICVLGTDYPRSTIFPWVWANYDLALVLPHLKWQ